MSERQGGVTFKGNPLTVIGDLLKVGDKAPDFKLLAPDFSEKTLADSAGKVRIISVVPSLDTPICDQQSRRFNTEIAAFGDKAVCLTISVDLPPAQKRWCGAAEATNVQTLSDHRDTSFGNAYGLTIKELRLLQRAVFVVDGGGVIRYCQYVPEVAEHPDYDAALAAAKELAG